MKKLLFIIFWILFLFIPQVHAQDAPCNPIPNKICGQTAYDTCTPTCEGPKASYYCYQKNNPKCNGTILCSPEDSRCAQAGPVKTECVTNNTVCKQATYDTCTQICTDDNKAAYFCYREDNPNCKGTILCDPENSRCAQTPKPTTPVSVPTQSPSPTPVSIPTTKPTPLLSPPKTVTAITINNQNLTPQVGSELKLKLPVADPTKEQYIPLQVLVTYSDGTSKFFFINFHYKGKPTESNEVSVDVFLDHDISNSLDIEQQVKNTIIPYINDQLAIYNIKKRLKFNRTSVSDIKSCTQWSDLLTNVYQPDKALLFLTSRPDMGWGQPLKNVVCLNYISDNNVFLHEFGHILGLPDYYLQDVDPTANSVTPIGITSAIQDVMYSPYRPLSILFDPTSREIANLRPTEAVNAYSFWRQFTPKQVILQISDDNNQPLSGARVEIFPQAIIWNGSSFLLTIPATLSFNVTTDVSGRASLGDQYNLFYHPFIASPIMGASVFLRINHNNTVRYTSITGSYLNNLYFQGQQAVAIIPLRFSSLLAAEPKKGFRVLSSPDSVASEEILSDQERNLLKQHIDQHLNFDLTRVSQTQSSGKNPYDLTGDGVVNSFDVANFIKQWQGKQCNNQIDFDQNKICNSIDYAKLKQNF